MYEAWNSCDRGYLDGEYEDTRQLVGTTRVSRSGEKAARGNAAVPEQVGGAHDLVNGAGSMLIV